MIDKNTVLTDGGTPTQCSGLGWYDDWVRCFERVIKSKGHDRTEATIFLECFSMRKVCLQEANMKH